MKDYIVTVREIEIYVVKVKANSEQEAEDHAFEEIIEKGESKLNYHVDSNCEADVLEVL